MWRDADSALRHVDRLQAAALALCGNRPDADDLVQEIYLSLLRRPRRLTGGSQLAYLLTMLRNRYIDDRRTIARRGASVPLDEHDDPVDVREGLRPDRALEHQEVLGAVHSTATDRMLLFFSPVIRNCLSPVCGRTCQFSPPSMLLHSPSSVAA